MLRETELRILSSFFPEGREITLKILMQRSGLSYEPIHRVVSNLAERKIVSAKKIGKTLVYSLVFEQEEAKIAFFFYAKSKLKEFSENHRVIFNALSKINKESPYFLAVFGSYAKGKATKDSDVDVICVSSDKKDDEREIKGLKYETSLDFIPIVIPKTEFKKIKRENEVFWSDLVKFGIIFKGYEMFYSEAYLK